MQTVGVKKLKAELSHFLRLVRAGETVLVTSRDEVVAVLRSPDSVRRPADSLQDMLDELASKGDLSRAARAKEGWSWCVKGLGLPEGTAGELLDEIREDRFLG